MSALQARGLSVIQDRISVILMIERTIELTRPKPACIQHLYPSLRPESLTSRNSLAYRGQCCVHRLKYLHVAPPLWCCRLGQRERKEDNYRRDDKAAVQGCRGDIVIVGPPAVVLSPDPPVEEQSN